MWNLVTSLACKKLKSCGNCKARVKSITQFKRMSKIIF